MAEAGWRALFSSIDPPTVLAAIRAAKPRVDDTSRPAGELLGEIAALLAQIAVRDPVLALAQTSDFAKAAGRALDEMPTDAAAVKPRALIGTIAYNTTMLLIGSRIPEQAVSTAERAGLGLLAQAELDEPTRTSACHASLGAGIPALLPILLGQSNGDGLPLGRPGDAPKRIDDALVYFGAALEAGWKQPSIEVAFQAWLAAFPARLRDNTLAWFDLASVARVYFTRFGGTPAQKTFASLSKLLEVHDSRPTKAAAMRSMPTPIASSAPKPRREPITTALDAPWARIALHDLEGLHGGFSVHAFADGDFWFDEVSAGARHSRLFRSTLPSDQLAALTALVLANDVRQIQIPMRNGIPGESRPTLVVTTPNWKQEVSKWRGDQHPSFDALASWLWSTGKRLAAVGNRPTWEGPFDWSWKPD
jgi:hypothetical protein